MNNPKVSILVPVYNVEKYIHKCIDSILLQTFTDFECILVDDCTPDSSGKICDEYALKDKRIKVIHKSKNEGLPQARKTGFEHSCGDYIQFIDSDDWIEPNMTESLYSCAVSNNYDMVCSDWYKHDKDNNITYNKMTGISNNYIQNLKNIVFIMNIYSSVWNKLYKRSVIENIEFPTINMYEDKVIITQALYYSNNIGYINSAFYHYIYNNNSILNNHKNEIRRYKEEKLSLEIILKFIKKNNGNNLKIYEPELGIRKKEIFKKHIKAQIRPFYNILCKIIPIKQ